MLSGMVSGCAGGIRPTYRTACRVHCMAPHWAWTVVLAHWSTLWWSGGACGGLLYCIVLLRTEGNAGVRVRVKRRD